MRTEEQKILKSAEKIKQNQVEDSRYVKQLQRYLQGKMPTNERLNLGSNPNILKLLNSTAKTVVINQSDIKNALAGQMVKTKRHTGGHQILPNELYKLSKEIREPIMVLRGSQDNPNSVVMITELRDSKGKNVIVPIALDRQNGQVNKITTLYGKDNIKNYLEKNKKDIIAVNVEKAEQLYKDIGFQSPKSTTICFNNSIAYTTENVTYDYKKMLEQFNNKSAFSIDKICKDLKANGFQPTKSLVSHMEKLSQFAGKEISIKEVQNIYISMKNPEIQDVVNEIAKECKTQEMIKNIPMSEL